ncbi:hypothetical protein [Nesterenkonia salmonea]|uniref:hypothetical protein n=1 Tax=Nesterenkonia salmonea TaxID=1804987 RepID=UPI001AA04DDD|nr:hypothetical protein [Nesterenkonia salmonea]
MTVSPKGARTSNEAGADRGAECVGYQAHAPQGNEDNAATLNNLVSSVGFTGGIGTVGVFVPEDPGGPDELSQQGKARFDFGNFWFKSQQMGCGQTPVKRFRAQAPARGSPSPMAD